MAVVLLSSPILLAQEVTTGTKEEATPKSTGKMSYQERIRKQIFADSLDKAGCKTVTTAPKFDVKNVDGALQGFLETLIESLAKKKKYVLPGLFHERMRVNSKMMRQTILEIQSPLRAPINYSLYRLWAINTVDGSPNQVLCDDGDFEVLPHYGYDLQFGLVLQALGQRELGRIYISIVPTPKGWRIGSLHFQQWTHASGDFQAWAKAAQKDAEAGFKPAAFIKFDIAAKLVEGSKHFYLPVHKDAIGARDMVMSRDEWEKEIRSLLKDKEVAFLAGLLANGGAGLLVRIRVKEQPAHSWVKDTCRSVVSDLKKAPWSKQLQGVRCNYLLPKEDPSRDGIVGGIYLAFEEEDKG